MPHNCIITNSNSKILKISIYLLIAYFSWQCDLSGGNTYINKNDIKGCCEIVDTLPHTSSLRTLIQLYNNTILDQSKVSEEFKTIITDPTSDFDELYQAGSMISLSDYDMLELVIDSLFIRPMQRRRHTTDVLRGDPLLVYPLQNTILEKEWKQRSIIIHSLFLNGYFSKELSNNHIAFFRRIILKDRVDIHVMLEAMSEVGICYGSNSNRCKRNLKVILNPPDSNYLHPDYPKESSPLYKAFGDKYQQGDGDRGQ